MAGGPDIAAAARELYAAEPSRFVAERKRLAAGLKAAGDTEGAAALAKLRKPSVIEDALNRTARSAPDAVEAWATAVEATEAAQSAAIGGGGAAALRAATAELRAATAAVVKAATRHAGAAKAPDLGTALQSLTTAGGLDLFRHGVLGSARAGEESELFAGAPEPPERRHPEPAAERARTKRTSRAPRPAAEPETSAAARRASAQALKRHAAEVAKATRAQEIAGREVARLSRELAQAQSRLAQAEQALADLRAAAPR